jgi:hypothetical protein
MTTPDPITFLATLPAIQSAVKFSGSKEGARVLLEIPEADIAQAARLLLVRGEVLRVTIEVAAQAESPPPDNSSW